MIDPYVELGGWVIAQAIKDTCGEGGATKEDGESAWEFLKNDPLVDEILEHLSPNNIIPNKREYILTIVIPRRLGQVKLLS